MEIFKGPLCFFEWSKTLRADSYDIIVSKKQTNIANKPTSLQHYTPVTLNEQQYSH